MPQTFKQDCEAVEKASLEITGVLNKLGIKTTAAQVFFRLALANTLLMDRKQQDYGPGNIKMGGTLGCVIRANDKFQRLFHLYQSGRRRKAVNESIIDSLRDISNYMIIALMVELNQWPSE